MRLLVCGYAASACARETLIMVPSVICVMPERRGSTRCFRNGRALARFADIDQVMGDRRPVLALKRQAPLLEQLELDNIGGHGREVVAALCPDGMGPARLLGIDARGGKSRMLMVKRYIGAVAALEAE